MLKHQKPNQDSARGALENQRIGKMKTITTFRTLTFTIGYAARTLLASPIWLLIAFSAASAAETQALHDWGAVVVREAKLQSTSPLPATEQLRLALALPLRNTEALSLLLTQLYDPASSVYHSFLTPEQFTQRFGPTEEDYQVLIAFAQAHGLSITATHPNRLLLDVSGSVADIERAFHVTLRLYPHPTENRAFFAPDLQPSVDLPVRLLGASGLNSYAVPHPRRLKATPIDQLKPSAPLLGSGPAGTYMGNDFRQAYVPQVSLDGTGQNVGLVEFDGFYAKDIGKYQHLAGLPRVRLKQVLLDGFKGTPGPNNIEVALDIEVAIAMAPGVAHVIVYEAGPNGNWHDMLNTMAGDNQAKQISCSWYTPGGGPDPIADQIFQQMAAQGQSFLNASGDFDAYSGFVDFPGATPYITQVGGTTLAMTGNGAAYASESAWNWNNGIGTGGGFSTNYPIPSWQQSANVGANDRSAIWRNVPDVALTADNVFVIANNGQQFRVAGTSCSAPLWAGFIALVNQQRLAAGKPSAGFLNPAVYALGANPAYPLAFHDVTIGNNTNANSPTDFFAVAGYDLCTGWGTPAGQELITALAGTDTLNINNPAGFAAGGPVGGPFSAAAWGFTLANQGTASLGWGAASGASWLTVSPNSGNLAASQQANVTVSLNATANSLNAGFYSGAVWFTNASSGFIQARQFSLAIAQGSHGATVLALNPVGYWQLNETASVPPADVVTDAGSLGVLGNGFGLAAPIQGQPGIVGQCFRFPNPTFSVSFFGSHVDVPYSSALNPSGPFTVELWAKPSAAVSDFFSPAGSVDASLNGGNSRFGWIFYQTPTAWEFRLGGGLNGYALVLDGGAPLIGAWNHLVGVFDGANASLYVNSILFAGPTPVSGFSPNTNIAIPLRLGAPTFPNRTFDGWVDEVAFYPNALGADRIAAHYATASTSPSGYPAQVLADNPLGFWHLDEPPYPTPGWLPTALNVGFLGSAANGAYQPGCLPGVVGVPGPGLGPNNFASQFNGTGYLDIPGGALNFTGPVSFALWTKPAPANGSLQTISGRGAGSYRLLLDASGHPHFADGAQPSGDVVGPARIDDGSWHQLVGVYDGANSEFLYVDGLLAASTTGATAPVGGNSDDLLIGANADVGLFQLFNGVVDEVCLFTNALTAAQVGQLFSVVGNSLRVPPVIQGIERNQGAVLLTWSAVAARSYQLQYKVSLAQTDWTNLGPVITANDSTLSASDLTTDSQRFYRVILLP
jgi:pro-kumamolisin-like protein/concanavalin A-like lectin/glucanase superfamily protein/BACON domain-containing protein